jgi:hypothetical protein
MKVEITQAVEAGMPAEMIKNCEQLLAWRIEKKNPKAGDPIDILYSESDPLMEKEDWGGDSYAIYFTVLEISSTAAKIELSY